MVLWKNENGVVVSSLIIFYAMALCNYVCIYMSTVLSA